MSNPRRRQLLLALISLVTVGSTALVATAGQVPAPAPQEWVATWAAGLAPASTTGKSSTGFTEQTVRMFVHTSVGGEKARVRLSNRFGKGPLTIGHATIALPFGPNGGPGDLKPGTIKDLTFFGQREIVIPAGGYAVSDPVDMSVPANEDLAVTIFFPVETGPSTFHLIARETAYFGPGNHATALTGAGMPETGTSWFYLAAVDVLNRHGSGAIVVLGDSITDGFRSTINADNRWTDYLSERLAKEAPGRAPAVVDLGMSGNLSGVAGGGGLGVNALARLHSDVFAQTGARTLIVQLGINDIWISKDNANNIIARLQQIAAQAKLAGLKVYVCTIMPWNAYSSAPDVINYTPELDSIRLTVNSYIRTGSDYDGYIDFDVVMRSQLEPTKLRAEWDSGDHIHPNDAGNEAMAMAVPLEMLL